jgi:small subunit ribosomal protein S14
MTTKAHFNKINKPVKFSTRQHRRCELCGRSRGVYRKFRICRICLRTMAHQGKIPGLKKASW